MKTKPWEILKETDEQIYSLIDSELARQRQGLELIASENFASREVICAMANVFANKYAEGLPSKRYYGGCKVVDELEDIAIERACRLFGASFCNVQPHSGAQANAAVFLALADVGDKILGLDLSHGGHLTHGAAVNFSGRIYEPHFYKIDPNSHRLDYDEINKIAQEVRPKIIICGASAYPREIDFKKFREIADNCGAYLIADMAHIAGLVAAGIHQSPVPYAHVVTTTTHKTLRGPRGGIILWNDESLTGLLNKGVFPGTQGGPLEHIIAAKAVCFKLGLEESFKKYQTQVVTNARTLAKTLADNHFQLVSGGTDNHLVLIDLSDCSISGKAFEEALGKVFITVNKNTVPFDKRSPFVTSGVRVGTPAVTSRGMKEDEMFEIGQIFARVKENIDNDVVLREVSNQVNALTENFPLYPEWTVT